MTGPDLNPNQRRRIGTHLRLLAEDVEALRAVPAVAGDTNVTPILAALEREVDRMRADFALPPDWRPSLSRRVAALAEVWMARVEDLRGRRLKGYGSVDPALADRLDPYVDSLRALLRRLADAAQDLPSDSA